LRPAHSLAIPTIKNKNMTEQINDRGRVPEGDELGKRTFLTIEERHHVQILIV
jgi:hypothetical protein